MHRRAFQGSHAAEDRCMRHSDGRRRLKPGCRPGYILDRAGRHSIDGHDGLERNPSDVSSLDCNRASHARKLANSSTLTHFTYASCLSYRAPYDKVRNRGGNMSTATITSKGQITIPAVVRTALGVQAGDRVEFVEVVPGRFELVAATQSVTALKGLIRKPASPVTIEAMNQAIAAQGAKAR